MLKQFLSKVVAWFYFPIIKRYVPFVTFRYAACGGGNMLLDWFLFAILYNFILDKENLSLGLVTISPYIAAFLIVFPITLFTGFYLMKNVAFVDSSLRGRTQLFRYILVVIANLLLNYFGLKLLVGVIGIYPTPSKVLLTVIATVVSYFSQRYFTFRASKTEGQ